MMRLEYDDEGRFVVPFHACGKRVAILASAETYCTYEAGHDGPCELPPNAKQVLAKIPCSCLDCRAKREGIVRQ
jgi:hypothetical protein